MKFIEECGMYNREAYFSKNNLYKWVLHVFATMSMSQKILSIEWKNTDSVVKKILGASVNEEGHAESLMKHEKTNHYWFL